jgi:hypothetical protein
MKKLRLDLDLLRVASFDTGGMALADAPTQHESFCTSGCTRQCIGTVYGADPGTVLTGGLLHTCVCARAICTASEPSGCNHTTA